MIDYASHAGRDGECNDNEFRHSSNNINRKISALRKRPQQGTHHYKHLSSLENLWLYDRRTKHGPCRWDHHWWRTDFSNATAHKLPSPPAVSPQQQTRCRPMKLASTASSAINEGLLLFNLRPAMPRGAWQKDRWNPCPWETGPARAKDK